MILGIPLGWLQLKRDRLRFLVGIAGVMFAVTLVFMQLGFHDALFASAVRHHERLIADLFLVSPQSEFLPRMVSFPRRRLYQLLGAPGVESVSAIYVASDAQWMNLATRTSKAIFVLGFDPDERALDLPEVERQRDVLRRPDVALFDEASRPEYGAIAAAFAAGLPLTVEVQNRAIGIVGLFALGTSFGIDGNLITSDLNFLRLFPARDRSAISIGLVRLAPGADPEATRERLAAELPPDVEVLTRRQYVAREQAYWGRATPIGFVFTFGVVMGLVVGGIIVYQILFTDIASHLAEYATLKAMGYRNAYLFGVVLEEALILAVLGYVPGLLASVQLYELTERVTRLPMVLDLATSLRVLALTIAMCCLSGAVALRKVRTVDPAEIF